VTSLSQIRLQALWIPLLSKQKPGCSLEYTDISIASLAVIYTIATTVETLTAGLPVGVVEITLINLFALYGVPIVIGGAATTLARILTFWCQILVGYPLVHILPLSICGITRKIS